MYNTYFVTLILSKSYLRLFLAWNLQKVFYFFHKNSNQNRYMTPKFFKTQIRFFLKILKGNFNFIFLII